MPANANPLIWDLSRGEIEDLCHTLGQPRFRAGQVWRWLYVQRVDTWDAMHNVPAKAREQFAAHCCLPPLRPEATPGSEIETRKLLVPLPDGEQVEAVLIPAVRRRTVCVSCQVGCKFKCAFCASGQAGFRRNLSAGEIICQVLHAAALWGAMPTNVVFMGIGEPFDNYAAVLKAIRILNDHDGLDVGARRITISTCGVIPGIARLADEGLQVGLSVSLHAPDDNLRRALMPVSVRYPLDDLLAACKVYFERSGRLVTFEYTLIHNLNDTVHHARGLVKLLAAFPCRVNLIPLSPVEEFPHEPSRPAAAALFVELLAQAGINATLRASKGRQVRAACGQLRFGACPDTLPDGGEAEEEENT